MNSAEQVQSFAERRGAADSANQNSEINRARTCRVHPVGRFPSPGGVGLGRSTIAFLLRFVPPTTKTTTTRTTRSNQSSEAQTIAIIVIKIKAIVRWLAGSIRSFSLPATVKRARSRCRDSVRKQKTHLLRIEHDLGIEKLRRTRRPPN